MNPGLMNGRKEDIIKNYFLAGFSYQEILVFLSEYHDIRLSLRRLHRILRSQSLYRRRRKAPINHVIDALKTRLEGADSSLGYRSMHLTLQNMGITTDRETVSFCLKSLDPDGVELRQNNRLKRRQYKNKGPNFLWHIDGFDKLTPFGFAIHAAIDG